MKRLSILIASLVISATVGFAHEGNDHVRGVVTQISQQSITVQTTDKKTTTLKLTGKTTYQLAGKTAHLADLKVGDRVVVDVPEKTTEALLVQIGTAAARTTASAAASKKVDIAFRTSPLPTRHGDNNFVVTVVSEGQPVAGADVSLVLTMPAMPAMKMPAMRNEVKLGPAGAGKYTGTGQVLSGGTWTVTVSVKQDGKEIGQKELKLTSE